METKISRHSFLETGAVALGTVAVCDFKGVGSAVAATGTAGMSPPIKTRGNGGLQ